KDVERFESNGWPDFIDNGLAKKVFNRETLFNRKPIPPEARGLYETLISHACHEILRRLADQTRATWDLLNRFHGELWSLKRSTGQLRFGDVTQELVAGLQRQVLRAEGLHFRLDGAIHHLLLDEFQDTSLPQWRVLHPIAASIATSPAKPPRSCFCVGDVKQAIYGWRGGMTAIF